MATPGTIVPSTAKEAKDQTKEEDGTQIGMDLEEKEEEVSGQQSGKSGINPRRRRTRKLNLGIKQQKTNPKNNTI